jgi:hypothetical protein
MPIKAAAKKKQAMRSGSHPLMPFAVMAKLPLQIR